MEKTKKQIWEEAYEERRRKKQISDYAYEQRQKMKGIRIRCFRLTDYEWANVKGFIKEIKENDRLFCKPCKKCGRMPTISYHQVETEENGQKTTKVAYIISCNHCHDGYFVFDLETAFNIWNKNQE